MLFLLLALSLSSSVYSLTIAFYLSLLGKSHLDFASALINILVERGHEVDLIIARHNSLVKGNGTAKVTRVIDYGFLGSSPWMESEHLRNPFNPPKFTMGFLSNFEDVAHKLCRIGLTSGAPLRFLKEKKYDAGITSDYEYCGMTLFKEAGIDTVLSYASTNLLPGQALNIGLPSPIGGVTGNLDATSESEKQSLVGKITRFLRTAYLIWIEHVHATRRATALAREVYRPDFPSASQLAQNIDIVFVNSNEIIEKPRPLSHKVKYIGGAALPKAKPVTKEFDSLLSNSTPSVIFSFGTQVPTENIPLLIRRNIAKAFGYFPNVTFLWKYERQGDEDDMFSNVTNLHLLKWLPQTDLLNDKRVVAFISHMGLNSFLEASYAGVPLVAIPLFADQSHNANIGVKSGTTVMIQKTEVTVENMVEALRKILYDKSYRANAKRIARLLHEKPENVRDQFVKWVEFAAAHKKLHNILNLPGNDMGIVEYYGIDCVAALIFILVFSLSIGWKVSRLILNTFSLYLFSEKTKIS